MNPQPVNITKESFSLAKKFIQTDIERELNLYRQQKQSAGNFLCALGLLCYTEFFGGLITGNFQHGHAKANFETFFRYMGKHYSNLIDKKNIDVYNIFRCGMAHEYFIKKDFSVGLLPIRNRRTGIGFENGEYFFVVEKYYDDFIKAVEKLEVTLFGKQ